MESEHGRRQWNSSKSILLLSIISLFSCIIGIILGSGGLWYYEQINTSSGLSQPGTPSLLPEVDSDRLTEDGFFIVANGGFLELAEFADESQIDFALLPATEAKQPTFAIRGATYPIGNLELTSYVAGIGVDAEFTQAGAVINSVFEESPAEIANLRPGEVIVSVNGEKPNPAMTYQPGKKDLFGAMQEQITLVVMSGTSSRTVQLPRTFMGTVDSTLSSFTNPPTKFTLEPKDDYVLLHVDKELKPGVYRFEFQPETVIHAGSLLFGPTLTPTALPTPMSTHKWIFVVK